MVPTTLILISFLTDAVIGLLLGVFIAAKLIATAFIQAIDEKL